MAATTASRSVPGTNSPAPRDESKLAARDDLEAPPLAELADLDDAGFRRRFAGSPIKRIGRDRFVRNVLIAIGNSGAIAASSRWPSAPRRRLADRPRRRDLGAERARSRRRVGSPRELCREGSRSGGAGRMAGRQR